MKKLLFFVLASAFAMTSCSTTKYTSTTHNVKPALVAAVLGDLDVSSQKISYTYTPSKEVSSAGLDNCISAAVLEALAANGGGDVLVETQTAVVERGFFNKIKSVTVSGYPARYKNFRPADAKALNAAVEKSDFTVQTKNRGNGGGFLKLLGL